MFTSLRRKAFLTVAVIAPLAIAPGAMSAFAQPRPLGAAPSVRVRFR